MEQKHKIRVTQVNTTQTHRENLCSLRKITLLGRFDNVIDCTANLDSRLNITDNRTKSFVVKKKV